MTHAPVEHVGDAHRGDRGGELHPVLLIPADRRREIQLHILEGFRAEGSVRPRRQRREGTEQAGEGERHGGQRAAHGEGQRRRPGRHAIEIAVMGELGILRLLRDCAAEYRGPHSVLQSRTGGRAWANRREGRGRPARRRGAGVGALAAVGEQHDGDRLGRRHLAALGMMPERDERIALRKVTAPHSLPGCRSPSPEARDPARGHHHPRRLEAVT